jgi:hypothetical protein
LAYIMESTGVLQFNSYIVGTAVTLTWNKSHECILWI